MATEKEIVTYVFRHMVKKDFAKSYLQNYDIKIQTAYSYEKISKVASDELFRYSDLITDNTVVKDGFQEEHFSYKKFVQDIRLKWLSSPVEFHLRNLKSGKLTGHSWHGAMPSTLHLSLQNKVRECIDGVFPFDELISMGTDIMKHEYFMVATHDLLESAVISNFETVIPSIGTKSISDFVFEGIPFDLKNTNYPNGWDVTTESQTELIKNLVLGADIDRMRKQAENTYNEWGLNRFYVIVEDQGKWLKDPEGVLSKFIEKIRMGINIEEIDFEGSKILATLIII